MPAILAVESVKKAYKMGKVIVPALKAVTFNVEEGVFVAIFGSSGRIS